MTLPTITPEMLKRAGAKVSCSELLSLANHWPDGAQPTAHNLREAQKLKANLGWFADRFLEDEALAEFNTIEKRLWSDYYTVMDEAKAVYEATRAKALATHHEAQVEALSRVIAKYGIKEQML
jgi:hypothetical protein